MQTAVVCRVTVNKRECDWMGMLGGGGSRTRYNICVTKWTNGENLGNHYFEYMCKLHSCDIEYMCELHSCDIEYMCKLHSCDIEYIYVNCTAVILNICVKKSRQKVMI